MFNCSDFRKSAVSSGCMICFDIHVGLHIIDRYLLSYSAADLSKSSIVEICHDIFMQKYNKNAILIN